MGKRWQWPWSQRQTTHTRVGIDIGSTAVKVLRVEVSRAGPMHVLGSAVQTVAEPTTTAEKAALQRAVTAAGVTERDVRLSIAGQDIITRSLALPTMTAAELDGAIRFEGETYIPFPLNDMVMDKQILESLADNKMRVLLVAGKRDTLQRRVAMVSDCGLHPILVDVDSLAVVNAYWADQDTAPAPQTLAVVHLGARYTNVAVLQRGQSCCFTRDLTIGGNDLTKTITEQLGVSAAEAEQLKCHPGPREAEVTAVTRRALELLASELRLSFDFYETQFEGEIERMVVSGGASLVPQVLPFLKEQLGVPAEGWTPQRWLARSGAQVSQETASQLAVCVGLVVREQV